MPGKIRILLSAVFCLAANAVPPATAAEDGLEQMAQRLAQLRSDVEGLSNELGASGEEMRLNLRSAASQKAELEMEMRREELRLLQLRDSRLRQKAKLAAQLESRQALVPSLKKSIGAVREAVRRGLPFRLRERQDELDRLEKQMEDGLLTPAMAMARLWNKVEDELRMAGESGLYSQVVEVGGQNLLADVVRLGMVMLFFSTRDGRYGAAVKENLGWRFKVFGGDASNELAAALFESFRKGIRTGFFEIPAGFLPERELP